MLMLLGFGGLMQYGMSQTTYSPQSPTSNDPISISVTESCPNQCEAVSNSRHSINGSDISVFLTFSSTIPPGSFCVLPCVERSTTYDLPSLPAGNYCVTVYKNGNQIGETVCFTVTQGIPPTPNLYFFNGNPATYSNQILTVRTTVNNNGTINSPTSEVCLLLSKNANGSNGLEVARQPLVALRPNTQGNVDFSVDLCKANLSAGTYYVEARVDCTGQITESDETDNKKSYGSIAHFCIAPCNSLVVQVSKTDPQNCLSPNGASVATVSGGNIPYRYLWSNNATTSSIQNLSAGSYQVTVTDAQNCTNNQIISLQTLLPTPNQPSVGGISQTSANINWSAVVGVNTYRVEYKPSSSSSWSNVTVSGTNTNLNNLNANTSYQVRITAMCGSESGASSPLASFQTLAVVTLAPTVQITAPTSGATFSEPANFTLQAEAIDRDSPIERVEFYQNNTLIATDLVAPYSTPINGLAAGTYRFEARAFDPQQNQGSSSPITIVVTPKPACNLSYTLIATATTCGLSNGKIVANITQGASPYRYAWSNNANSSSITNLSSGNYALTVTDANGCQINQNTTVSSSSSTVPKVSYTIDKNGLSISIRNSSTQASTWNWDFGDGATSKDFAPSHSYARAGTYLIKGQAGNDCIQVEIPGQSISVTPLNSNDQGLILDLGEVESAAGAEANIPLYVRNFKEVLGFQFSIQLGSADLEILEIVNQSALSAFTFFKSSPQVYSFIWTPETPRPISLADSTVVLALRVKMPSNLSNGTCIPILLSGVPTDLVVFQNINGVQKEIAPEVRAGEACIAKPKVGNVQGRITWYNQRPFEAVAVHLLGTTSVTEPGVSSKGLSLKISDLIASIGQEVLIPVRVNQFQDILGAQGSIRIQSKDAELLDILNNQALTQLRANRIDAQHFSFIWISDDPVSLDSNSILFTLKVKVSTAVKTGTCLSITFENDPVECLIGQLNNNSELTLTPTTLSGQLSIGTGQCNNNPTDMRSTLTDLQGNYSFKDLTFNQLYTLHPLYSKNHLNGVNVADILALRQHILNEKRFANPQQYIAADVNGNKLVNVVDITWFQRLILGEIDSFPNQASWKFVADQDLNNVQKGWTELPFEYQFKLSNTDQIVNFTGIKMGDITQSAQLRQSTESLNWRIKEQYFSARQNITILLQLNADGLEGLQQEWKYDPAVLSFDKLTVINSPIPVAYKVLPGGRISMVAFPGLEAGTSSNSPLVIQLELKSIKAGQLSQVLTISTDRIPAFAQNGNQICPIEMRVESATGRYPLQHHQVVPNPFQQQATLEIYSEHTGNQKLEVYNLQGQLVKRYEWESSGGTQRIPLTRLDLWEPGMYTYQLWLDESRQVGKFILIQD
jgi:hypothetical protein